MPQAKKPLSKMIGSIQGMLHIGADKKPVVKSYSDTRDDLKCSTMALYSLDTISISEDPNTSSYVTGLIGFATPVGFALADQSTGAVSNSSDRTYSLAAGSVSIQPSQSGQGTDNIVLFSEYSDDLGLNWTVNEFSRRGIRVSKIEESFSTKVSAVVDWIPGRWVRFRLYTNGTVSILPISSSVENGSVVTSPSFAWQLIEC